MPYSILIDFYCGVKIILVLNYLGNYNLDFECHHNMHYTVCTAPFL